MSRKLHRIIRAINSETPFVNKRTVHPLLLAFIAGLITVAGFAPWNIFPLPVVSLAVLFWLWSHTDQPRDATLLGFFFGLGLFGAGIGWIYIALHEYGNMPLPLAVLATLLFVAFYALFPALVGWLHSRIALADWIKLGVLLPALWVSTELLRGYLFTGFPWLVLGYSQVPYSPLAGYAPLLGVYGVSLMIACSAGGLALLTKQEGRHRLVSVLLISLWLIGAALHTVAWTHPTGSPFTVSLLQGNIAQDEKFAEGQLVGTLETYRRLTESSHSQLIVFPETALPLLRGDLPESYAQRLREYGRLHGSDILVGAFEKDQGLFYNSMFSFGNSDSQTYRKNHMVPFGEFIPLRSVFGWIITDVLNIPMGDLSSGGEHQPLLHLAGQQIAMNICYEDVFGEEIIRALPQATLLLNTSNDAWYGNSSAAIQHNQISQMRALETGRMMLRATNTGVTSVIGSDGTMQQMLPQHSEGVLTVPVQGYAGATPYVLWGNTAIFFILTGIMFWMWRQWQRSRLVHE